MVRCRAVKVGGKLKGVGVGIALLALGAFAAVALGATPGELSFVGAKVQGQGGVDGITGPDDVAVSRDGRSVYAVGGER